MEKTWVKMFLGKGSIRRKYFRWIPWIQSSFHLKPKVYVSKPNYFYMVVLSFEPIFASTQSIRLPNKNSDNFGQNFKCLSMPKQKVKAAFSIFLEYLSSLQILK